MSPVQKRDAQKNPGYYSVYRHMKGITFVMLATQEQASLMSSS